MLIGNVHQDCGQEGSLMENHSRVHSRFLLTFFFLQTREELVKCSWPTRDELKGSTWMVLAAVFMLGFFTFMADLFLGDMFIQRFLLEYLAKGGLTT